MSHEESISLEETNKHRIALGLKPLTDDKAPVNAAEKRAEDNYAEQREKEAQERENKRIQDQIAKVRNRRELNARLKGTTLGDADDDVDNTRSWLKKSKKKEKELAAKRLKEIQSIDDAAQGEYGERDLEGLKVSHDFTEMGEGEARVLTLKDSRILDDEEDELQNVELAEEDRRKKNQDLKIKRSDYTGYDDEEFEPGKAGVRRGVLSKYDTVIDGEKSMEFRLGSSMKAINQKIVDQDEIVAVSVNRSLLSVDYAKNIEISDYLQEGDVGFKKPKKKKRHNNKRVIESSVDDAPTTADGDEKMQVDEKPIIPEARDLDVNFVDDDDLQAVLARSRRAKLRKPQKLSPEEVAKKITEQRAQSMNVDDGQTVANEDDGLTFDDTSEFVRSITYDPSAVKKEPEEATVTRRASPLTARPDIKMEETDVALAELEAGEVAAKEDYDDEMLDAIADALKATEAHEQKTGVKTEEGDLELGTSGEKTHSSGLAATLNILRHQGILATPTAESVERERVQLQRDMWLADQRRMIAQREVEKQRAKGGNKDQAQREYENRLREQQETRANLEAFKDYKPDVNIVYHDEFGRELTPKEAWKALSHKFHGKGSGRMKTEKRLKKIAEERKQEAMASGDTPLSMNQAFQKRQEKAGQAHFVLSVGNRGAVPQVAEFLDVQPLSKGKTERTKKKKEAKAAQLQNSELTSDGFITLPAGTQHVLGGEGITPTGSSPSTPANASPAPRPGFARISSTFVESRDGGSGTATPNGLDGRTRVAFGFGSKRKAGNEHEDSPPPKRR